MRLLITGAAGLLGSALDREACARGHEVHALDRAQCDVTSPDAVRATISEVRPEVLVHCAAYTSVDRAEVEPELAELVNHVATRCVVSTAAELGALPVYVSTDYVFDGGQWEPYLPAAAARPLSVYGRTKLLGETATAGASRHHLIVRTSWLYGDEKGFVPTILRRAEEGMALRVVDDQTGRPTWAPSAATAMLDLLDRGARGIWHVAGQGTCTWMELARRAVTEAGITCDLEAVSTADFGASAQRPSYSVMALEATERLLGREMTHWRDDLSRFLESRDG